MNGFARIWGVSLCCGLLGCAGPVERPTPDALIATGWDQYRLGEFQSAVRSFQDALACALESSPTQQAARYGLATTWNLRRPGEDPEKAAALYREVMAQAPTSDLAAWSALALARMKSLPVGGEYPALDAQVTAYQHVVDQFPHHSAGEEAFLFQQAAQLRQPDVERTRAVLEALDRFVATHAASPWRSAAHELRAHCCKALGLRDEILAATIQSWKTLEDDPLNPIKDHSWAYWRIATVAEFETQDFELAREHYRKLIAEYPREQRVFLARQELRRMDELEAEVGDHPADASRKAVAP